MDRLARVYMVNLELFGLEYFAVRAITKDAKGRREFLDPLCQVQPRARPNT
jgi:hypothetical protein